MYVHGGHIMTQLWTGHRYYLLCIPYSMLRKLPASLHVLGKTEERNMCFEFSEPLKWRANWNREARYWENREEMRAWLRFRCVWRPRVILLFGKQYVPKFPSPLVYFTDAKTVLTRIIHHLFEIFHCWTVYSSWKMLGNVIMLCRYTVCIYSMALGPMSNGWEVKTYKAPFALFLFSFAVQTLTHTVCS